MKGIDRLVKEWLDKSQEDLEAALILLNSGKGLEDIVCFHAQQAVEKLLKAFLISKGISPPKTHDIDLLYELCVEAGCDFSDLEYTRREIATLSLYAVEVRYPDGVIKPSPEKALRAVKMAMALKELVRKQI